MKKRLLKEETTRRFMKLANLQPIREGYFEEEEDPEVGMDADLPPGPEMGGEDPTLDAEPEVEPEGPGCTDDVVSLVDVIAAAIESHTGCAMTVASDGGADEELPLDDAPLEDEEPVMEAEKALEEEDTVTEDTVTEDTVTEDDGIEEALNEANIQLADEKEEWLINETLRRVTKRLIEASKK